MADGALYIADTNNNRIRRVGPDGIITTVAGVGPSGFPGSFSSDGVPATIASLNRPAGVAVGPDGSLYIADTRNNRIRRVGPDGIITTVAGIGPSGINVGGFSGDTGPATAARLNEPGGVALGIDGSIYIADTYNSRIRRVAPDGTITTFAGTGQLGFAGDGGPATAAQLGQPTGVAVGPDGSVYIADLLNNRIRRVALDGTIVTVAGSGPTGVVGGAFAGDGSAATSARLNRPSGVFVGGDGSLYIADTQNHRVRRVGSDGIISTLVGTGEPRFGGDAGPAAAAQLRYPLGMSVAEDGSLYIADSDNTRIRRVTSVLPSFGGEEQLIPSEDGSEVYLFSKEGRHLRTLDALTGLVRYQLAYDSAGRLSSVTDGDGNVTAVERDSAGNPTALIAPGGQRTSLTLNAEGSLSAVSDPGGNTFRVTYGTGGLLATFTDPNGNPHRMTYDTHGRLTRDEGPDGGFTALARTTTPQGVKMTVTTAEGLVSTYETDRGSTGEIVHINIDEAGARTEDHLMADGTETTLNADGTRISFKKIPDARWGMLVPQLQSMTVTSPSGTTETISAQQTISLADPKAPLSLQMLTQSITVNGKTYTTTYDAATRTVTQATPVGRQSPFVLDASGHTVSILPATGTDPITFTYDNRGRLVREQQGTKSFDLVYDSRNRIVSRTNAAGEIEQYTYDNADHVTQITTADGAVSHYTYDANGNPTELTMPSGVVYSLTYTPTNEQSGVTLPGDAGSYSQDISSDGSLIQALLPSGRTEDYTADLNGRPTGFSYAEATNTISYNAGDPTDRASLLRHAPAGGGTPQDIALTYDGDLVTGIAWSGSAQGEYHYTYDSNRLISSIQFISGADTVTRALTHDADGLLTQYGPFALTPGGPAGAVSQITDGTLNLSLGYDTTGHVSTRTVQVNGQDAYQFQLSRDNLGQVVRKLETLGGVSHTYDYGYDALGQLTEVRRDGTVVESYAYDADGNRTSRLGPNGPALTTCDAQGRLVQQGDIAYQFDVDGYLVQRGNDSFHYSTRGELLQATVGGQTITYGYDALGRRVTRTDTTGTYQYLYGNASEVFQITDIRDPAGQLTTLSYDPHGFLIALDRSGARYYVATDSVGTPRTITDGTGTAVKVLDYDSFGNRLSDSNPAFDLPIGYAGGLQDAVTGLVRFGFRDFDPAAGRWTARDPLLFGGGQANLYAYAANDPVNQRDPTGMFCLGASAYAWIGGGAQVCVNPDGFSLCAELGVGLGDDIEVVPNGGLAENAGGFFAEFEVALGPLGGFTFGGSDDICGLHGKAELRLGPIAADLTNIDNPVMLKLDEFGKDALKEFASKPKFGLEAKVGIKGCQTVRF